MKAIKAYLYREYRITTSSPRFLVENILNPLFILFIFGVAMNSAVSKVDVNGVSVPYLSYFLVGNINLCLVSNSLVSATRIFLDKYVGYNDDLFSYPVARSSILIAKLIFHAMLSTIQLIIMVLFVFILYPANLNLGLGLVAFLLISLFGSFGWFFILIYASYRLKTQDGFNTMYYLIMTPLIFLSSIYYPVEKMP